MDFKQFEAVCTTTYCCSDAVIYSPFIISQYPHCAADMIKMFICIYFKN